jgi:hypothetical protein
VSQRWNRSFGDPHLRQALAALALNLVQLASTAIWQRKLQAEMAESGYDEAKARLLICTNWIRTFALLGEAVLAMAIVARVLAHLAAD